jgi:hypothetical protein
MNRNKTIAVRKDLFEMYGNSKKPQNLAGFSGFMGILSILRIQIGNEGFSFFHFFDFIYAFDVGT